VVSFVHCSHRTVALTSQDNGSADLCKVLGSLKDNYDTSASVFVVLFNGFMSLTSYFDVMYRY
jgi:hypothetical protein